MSKERIIKLLEDQLAFQRGQVKELNKQIKNQSKLLESQAVLIEELKDRIEEQNKTLASLEESLKSKDIVIQKEKEGKRALGKLLKTKSEKQKPVPSSKQEEPKAAKPPVVRKGNNNAKRKEFICLEIEEHDVYPDTEGFDPQNAKPFKTVDSIRYAVVPPRFIKHIYHVRSYIQQDHIVAGKAPLAPLFNSNYDSSILAYMIQLRYIYSMPIERMLKLFAEAGFDLNKSTAHGLISKAAKLFGYLEKPLKEAILEDDYVHMDETWHTVLDPSTEQKPCDKPSKVYLWSILAHKLNLIQFFYDNGSRGRKVLTDYLPRDYKGIVQSDGFIAYQILEGEDYHDVYRLPCLQHCKRKFIDIPGNKQAAKVVEQMNKLYQIEHRRPPGLTGKEAIAYKEKYMAPVLDHLQALLIKIKNRKSTLPKSKLGKAVNYALGEFEPLRNILRYPDCDLDNNAIERHNRYVALSRKNSLFFANHNGAKNGALIYSLACSCRLNGLNTFDYFKGLLDKLALVTTATKKEYLRELLPDKWGK